MADQERDTFGLRIVSSSLDGDVYIPEGADARDTSDRTGRADPGTSRPVIGVFFACSNQYVRVLRNATGDGYLARCPRCAKTLTVRVGQGGSSQRMFKVTCQ